jgi:glycosyltransferase involved in cell wall biosynthesis
MSLLVTCMMPTFNKGPSGKWLIDEAVESFHRQDYKTKELIIVNDCPAQTVVYDHPDVLVVNLPRRCRSLGEKLNFIGNMSQGDLLLRWDDDDISLPWRISQFVTGIEAGADYWRPRMHWARREGDDKNSLEYGGIGIAGFTRQSFAQLRGFPFRGAGEDQEYEGYYAKRGLKSVSGRLPYDEVSYIYRWDTDSRHISGFGINNKGYEVMGRDLQTVCDLKIEPFWKQDYVALTRSKLAGQEARYERKREAKKRQ